MEEVLRRWPHAASRVEALRAEHEQFLREAERLLELSDETMEAWATAGCRLLAAIREHERREDRVIQDVFCLDVGGGD